MTREERAKAALEKRDRMLVYENRLYEGGCRFVAGIDEVGRGPLAGPVVAAAVVLPRDCAILGIDDSKKIPEARRERLYEEILAASVAWGIGLADSGTIDRINILEATKRAMLDALSAAASTCPVGHVLIDALTLPDCRIPQTGIVKGDSLSLSIAAASIVAKVYRDRLMRAWSEEYPGYGFDRNKGYGTPEHYEGLRRLGMTPIHRRSFLRNLQAAINP